MTFASALADNQIDVLANMQFGTNCYMLIWDNNVLMTARVNQATFTDAIASITYDGAVGDYNDALEGYTVWLSATDDIRAAYWYGRLRTAATTTALPIEYSSVAPDDDDYIFITKDIRLSLKQARFDSNKVLFTDYDVPYSQPAPTISGIETVYFAQTNETITITPAAQVLTPGATISAWTLDNDGGTTVSFNAGTGAAVISYATGGNYMPRFTVTDSNGNDEWFSPFVFIGTDVIEYNFQNVNIQSDFAAGWNASVPMFDGVQNVLDGTMCAIYMPHKTGGNKIMFVGVIRSETITYAANGKKIAGFELQGLAAQLSNLTVLNWSFTNEDTPADARDLQTATPWRFAGVYFQIATNLNNIYSLSYDDVTDDYEYSFFFTEKGNALQSLRNKLWSTNSDFEFTSTGNIKLERSARHMSTAERAALTIVANFEVADYHSDNRAYSLQLDHTQTVGKIIMGAGWYNTTTGSRTVLMGITPAVVQSRGTEQSSVDDQILKADQAPTEAKAELFTRVKNSLAASQQIDTLVIDLPGGFIGKINPSINQWYTHTITVEQNNRLISYDTNTRWLLTDIAIKYDMESGSIVLSCTFQIETESLRYSAITKEPPPVEFYKTPVLPPMAPYPGLPPFPGSSSSTGTQPGDEQPVEEGETDDVDGAKDPAVTGTATASDGTTVAMWTTTELSVTTNLNISAQQPTWGGNTPPAPAGYIIKQFAWNRNSPSGRGGYCIVNNDDLATASSFIYYNEDVVASQVWQETELPDMLATMVNATSKLGVIVYGKFKTYTPAGGFPISGLTFYGGTDDMSGDGTPDLLPSSHASLSQPASEFPGVYDSSTQVFKGSSAPAGGMGCTIKWPIPPGVRITSATMRIHYNRPITTTDGYKRSSIEGDTLQFGSLTSPALLENHISVNTTSNMPIEPGTQTHLYFNCAVDKKSEDGAFAWIEGIEIAGTIETDWAGTNYSGDNGETFDGPIGTGQMTLGNGSLARNIGQRTLATKDEQVSRALLAGLGYGDADQGSTPSQYAIALWKFGLNDDYMLAPDGGAVGLYKIVTPDRTDVTPNDGAADGVAFGPGCIAMTNKDNRYVYFLASFGGLIKLAYSVDLGANWLFNTTPTSNATWVDTNHGNIYQVYISDGSSLLYSQNSGVDFAEKTGPAAALKGVAAL